MSDPVRERWKAAGEGWRRRADTVRAMGMPVSAWMIDQLQLQPGHEVLELAAGPGDTGFMAAELVRPGGRLICSDAVEPMLAIARERAEQQDIENVEFKLLELEWIDLETASVDALLCRWGIMFVSDQGAAAREMRRVLRPGGRVALAVWDAPERNPWATIPRRALLELGHAQAPEPGAPDMFALAEPGRLHELLQDGGFTDVHTDSIEISSERSSVEQWLEETTDLSRPFAEVRERLDRAQWNSVLERVRALAEPFTGPDGTLRLPGSALVGGASA
jgi:SAM-dependent methyltransferase